MPFTAGMRIKYSPDIGKVFTLFPPETLAAIITSAAFLTAVIAGRVSVPVDPSVLSPYIALQAPLLNDVGLIFSTGAFGFLLITLLRENAGLILFFFFCGAAVLIAALLPDPSEALRSALQTPNLWATGFITLAFAALKTDLHEKSFLHTGAPAGLCAAIATLCSPVAGAAGVTVLAFAYPFCLKLQDRGKTYAAVGLFFEGLAVLTPGFCLLTLAVLNDPRILQAQRFYFDFSYYCILLTILIAAKSALPLIFKNDLPALPKIIPIHVSALTLFIAAALVGHFTFSAVSL